MSRAITSCAACSRLAAVASRDGSAAISRVTSTAARGISLATLQSAAPPGRRGPAATTGGRRFQSIAATANGGKDHIVQFVKAAADCFDPQIELQTLAWTSHHRWRAPTDARAGDESERGRGACMGYSQDKPRRERVGNVRATNRAATGRTQCQRRLDPLGRGTR